MTTETIHKDFSLFDTWPLDARLDALLEANQRAAAAVRLALPELTRAGEGLRDRLGAGGRLVYIGAGTSGRLALQDAAELKPTFGFERTLVLLAGGEAAGKEAREGAEDDEGAGTDAVRQAEVGPEDVVIGVAASGRTPYTVAGLKEARIRDAFTVGVANNPGAPLLEVAHAPILLETGPEVIAGSTRLAAGTAQKIALNSLSTAIMPDLGRVYKNLMVGMRPVNDKLYSRAVQIVVAATGAAETEAREALEETAWNLRQAIVCIETGLEPDASRALLEQHGDYTRKAVRAGRR